MQPRKSPVEHLDLRAASGAISPDVPSKRPTARTSIHLIRVQLAEAKVGAIAVIQRFNSAAAASQHFHTLFLDGGCSFATGSEPIFHPTPAPTDEDVARVTAAVSRRVERVLRDHEPTVTQRRFEESAPALGAHAAAPARR